MPVLKSNWIPVSTLLLLAFTLFCSISYWKFIKIVYMFCDEKNKVNINSSVLQIFYAHLDHCKKTWQIARKLGASSPHDLLVVGEFRFDYCGL